MEHFNYVDFLFCFVYLVSPTLPFLDFLQEEEDSSETVLIPTRCNTTDTTDRCNKTLEFGKTHTNIHTHTHTHTYAHIYNICVTICQGIFPSFLSKP